MLHRRKGQILVAVGPEDKSVSCNTLGLEQDAAVLLVALRIPNRNL